MKNEERNPDTTEVREIRNQPLEKWWPITFLLLLLTYQPNVKQINAGTNRFSVLFSFKEKVQAKCECKRKKNECKEKTRKVM